MKLPLEEKQQEERVFDGDEKRGIYCTLGNQERRDPAVEGGGRGQRKKKLEKS